MENNTLKASIGINFSLIGTQLHTMYEKNKGGYAVLLAPSEQTPDSGISVKDLIDGIENMAKGVTDSDTVVDTTQLEKAMTKAAREGGSASVRLENVVIKLQMAHLYICKEGENFVLEHAFQPQVVTEGLVPETIKPTVDVTNLSISIWSTGRKKVADKMALITVNECLGVAIPPDKSQAAKQHRKRNIQCIVEELRERSGRNEPETDVVQYSRRGRRQGVSDQAGCLV